MKITDVRITMLESPEGKKKAFASITFDDCFAVHSLSIIETDDGVVVAMPSRINKKGERKDIAHPLNTEFREYITEEVVKAYKELTK